MKRWALDLKHAAFRRLYYTAMYSGLRALRNRAGSAYCALTPRLEAMSGETLTSTRLGTLVLHVHPRACRNSPSGPAGHGVFSLRRSDPPVGRVTYRLVCSTSHFGCGHVEVAFHERAGVVTFYGVRNIARANAQRLGLSGLSDRLRLRRSNEDVEVLRAVATRLRARGFEVRHAPAEECVRLTVDDRLVPRGRDAELRERLRRRYGRLCEAINGAATSRVSPHSAAVDRRTAEVDHTEAERTRVAASR